MFLLFLGLLACDKKNQDPKTEQTTEPPVEDTTTPTEETGDPSEEPQAASIVVSTNGVLLHGTDETKTVSIQVLDLSGEQIIDPLIEFEILDASIISVDTDGVVTPLQQGITSFRVVSEGISSESVSVMVTPEIDDLQIIEQPVELTVEQEDPFASIDSVATLSAMSEQQVRQLDRMQINVESDVSYNPDDIIFVQEEGLYVKAISSVENGDGSQNISVEEVTLSEVFPTLEFDTQLDLELAPREEILDYFDVVQDGGSFTFTPKERNRDLSDIAAIECKTPDGIKINLADIATIDNFKIQMLDEDGNEVGTIKNGMQIRYIPAVEQYVITTPFLQDYQYKVTAQMKHNVAVQVGGGCKLNVLKLSPMSNIVSLLIGLTKNIPHIDGLNIGVDFGIGIALDVSANANASLSYTSEMLVNTTGASGLAINKDIYESCSALSKVRCAWNLATETSPFTRYGEEDPEFEVKEWETSNVNFNGEVSMQGFLGVYAEFVMGSVHCREGSDPGDSKFICIKLLDGKAGVQVDFQFDAEVENQLNERGARDGISLAGTYSLVLGELGAKLSPAIEFQFPAIKQWSDSAELTGTPKGKLIMPTSNQTPGGLDADDYLPPYIEWEAQSDGDIAGWIAGISSVNDIKLYAYNHNLQTWETVYIETNPPLEVISEQKVRTTFDISHNNLDQILSSADYTNDFSQYVQFGATFGKMGKSWEVEKDSITEHFFTCPGLFSQGVSVTDADIEDFDTSLWATSGNFYPARFGDVIDGHNISPDDGSLMLKAGNDGVLGSGGGSGGNATYGFGRFQLDIPETTVDCLTVSFEYQVVTSKAGYYHPYFDLDAQQYCADVISDENQTYSPNIYIEFQTAIDGSYESIGTTGDFPWTPQEYFCSSVAGETNSYAYTDWIAKQVNIPVEDISTLENANFFINVYGGYGDEAHWVYFNNLQVKQCDTCLD